MSAIFEDITAAVGYTPLVKINKQYKRQDCTINDRSGRRKGTDKKRHCNN
jgi:hypothetical protein